MALVCKCEKYMMQLVQIMHEVRLIKVVVWMHYCRGQRYKQTTTDITGVSKDAYLTSSR